MAPRLSEKSRYARDAFGRLKPIRPVRGEFKNHYRHTSQKRGRPRKSPLLTRHGRTDNFDDFLLEQRVRVVTLAAQALERVRLARADENYWNCGVEGNFALPWHQVELSEVRR